MQVELRRRRLVTRDPVVAPNLLLIGPYDPHCGEYTFLAPPLGVWRLQGFLAARGIHVAVFDPNLRPERVREDFDNLLSGTRWDVIGVSTTGMTLQFDLALAHAARLACPNALILAGGMEATFARKLMFTSGPFDMVVSGEGEHPLLEICRRIERGGSLEGVPGTTLVRNDGELQSFNARAMDAGQLKDAIFDIPYARMPYESYWERLETAYGVSALPYKAQREATLAEIRSVRLITLNYCPMGCTFCSSTNFLQHAQGSSAGIARLSADDCIRMIEKIVAAHHGTHNNFPRRYIRIHERQTCPPAMRKDCCRKKVRIAADRSAVHQHQSNRCHESGTARRHARRGLSRPRIRDRELLARRPGGV